MKFSAKIDMSLDIDINLLLEYTLLEVIKDEIDNLEACEVEVELIKDE